MLVLVAIGTVLWCRARRRRRGGANALPGADEESVPLTAAGFGIGRGLNARENGHASTGAGNGSARLREKREGKGKERERLLGDQEETVFEVGESEDERSERGH